MSTAVQAEFSLSQTPRRGEGIEANANAQSPHANPIGSTPTPEEGTNQSTIGRRTRRGGGHPRDAGAKVTGDGGGRGRGGGRVAVSGHGAG